LFKSKKILICSFLMSLVKLFKRK